ncbi:MAG TPA: GNAT family protein [Armatimonadota bacterium]|nr:GNAT family protein [Armatimonadota bacterium]
MPVYAGPPISGASVSLRRVSEDQVLLAGRDSDLELARDARCFYKATRDEATLFFGLCTEAGDLVGQVILQRQLPDRKEAVLGIHIFRPENRYRGYGSDAVAVACAYGFQELGLGRIVLSVSEANEAARRCYQKCGFTEVGRVKDEPNMIAMVLGHRLQSDPTADRRNA